MKTDPSKGFQSSTEIIRLAVMLYVCFTLLLRDIEDLAAGSLRSEHLEILIHDIGRQLLRSGTRSWAACLDSRWWGGVRARNHP